MNRPGFCCALLAVILVSPSPAVFAGDPQASVSGETRMSAPAHGVSTAAETLDTASQVGGQVTVETNPSAPPSPERLMPGPGKTLDDLPEGDNETPRGVVGACCYGETQCDISDEAGCITEGLHWIGPGTTCADCPLLPTCPVDTAFSQSPGNPFEYGGAGVSEQSVNLIRYENFSGIVGPLTKINFYGFDLAVTPGGHFYECVESLNEFVITFYRDLGNRPGEEVCSYDLVATRTPTGVYYEEGYELNEYKVDLPSPCVLTRGWVSIVGRGDTSCLFVWSSPPAGSSDEFSLCEGCTQLEQGMDLSMCLRGTYGGVTGACCDDSDGTCAENIEIYSCLGPTQRFAPDTSCEALSPPCGVTIGACCGGDMTRSVLCEDGVTEAECQGEGETFTPNGVCRFLYPPCGVPAGPCCVGTLSCAEMTTEEDCNAEGWTWLGSGATCADCPSLPPCPAGSLFAQPPLDIGYAPALYTSEEIRGIVVYDDFSGVAGTITDLQFYGVDLEPIGPNSFIECEEPVPDFEITFYEDQGGGPGPAVSTQFVPSVRTPTGITYRGAEYNLYEVELPEPVVMTRGWISIVGRGSPTCYFLWAPSADPAGGSARYVPEYGRTIRQGNSFAFCLIGTPGGVSGACCNQATGQCADNVPIGNCVGPDDRFAPDAKCAIALADCGVPKGACCLGRLGCQFVTDADCSVLGGDFLGVDSACLDCPCEVFCQPGSILEGEANCSPSFADSTNYGCDGPAPIFTTLERNERCCGTTGIAYDGENFVVDTDWYQIEIDDFNGLLYLFESESPARIQIIDASNGCPGLAVGEATVDPCTPTDVFAPANPGTYWIKIEPIGPSDASACGAAYVLTPLNAPCSADYDFDLDVDMVDFSVFQAQFGMSGPDLFGDLNADEIVDITDAHLFEQKLGTICP